MIVELLTVGLLVVELLLMGLLIVPRKCTSSAGASAMDFCSSRLIASK